MEAKANGHRDDDFAADESTASSSAFEAAPGLARIAAGAWLRTAGWTAGSALRASRRIAGVATGRESAIDLARDAQAELVDVAQRVLGVSELEQRLVGLLAKPGGDSESADEALRRRGYELLERSSELAEQGETHPAYARILGELSPDEARILRLLAVEGPQPAVDIRTWRPLDVGSSVIAPGLTMIGENAGCRHRDRLPAYLSNLFRLGLIWFSRERLDDLATYQVLEAQPDVIEAMREAGRARIVRRSIHLTPFGGHFCSQVLPLDTVEIEALDESSKHVLPAEGP
jgi:Abortive infection alpha